MESRYSAFAIARSKRIAPHSLKHCSFVAMSVRSIRHLAEYLAVRAALSLIQAVSLETCAAVVAWVAWLAASVLKIRGRVVEENLRIAFPEKTAAERATIARR